MELAALFAEKNEPFAAGFFACPDRSKFYRFACAFGRYFAQCALPPYTGTALYPAGWKFGAHYAVAPDYSYTYTIDWHSLREKCGEEGERAVRGEMALFPWLPTPHAVGGYGYVHSFPHYARIEAEGLRAYRARVEGMRDRELREGLLVLLDGIETYHARVLALLREANAPEELIEALTQVPFSPARSVYEALVCRNFIFYLDLCDNPGRLDADFARLHRGEDMTALFGAFFDNVDANSAWSMALGPDYNALTVQILRALKGRRRPSAELRVTPDMPEEVWEAAIESIRAGGGSPSLYNEPLYQQALAARFPQIPEEDLRKFNGGGCTETMLAGVSRVGSLDMGINSALVFRNTLTQSLARAQSFEAFCEQVMADQRAAVDQALGVLEQVYRHRLTDCPHPMRTLLVDDCIDRETDFNAGGARYNWSIINFAGIVNVIDSLLAIRELVFEKKRYSGADFLALLDAQDEAFYAELKKCPCYGVDDARADALAGEFTEKLFALLDDRKPVFGEGFLASSIQFTTYVDAGRAVGPTPDGRRAGDPLADSLAPVHGKDKRGPTALLNSVTALPLSKALGTPVLNLSLSPEHVSAALRPLIAAYFERGGMQAQITCVSREDLLDALVHPEAHESLVVRIGGYAEYFNRLPYELKQTVIARTVQV